MIQSIGFGGGGMKGILHIGALQELSKHQSLNFPDGVYGCSIGSIIGTYVAFSLPIEGLIEFIKKHSKFEDVLPTFSINNITGLFTTKGLYDMDILETLILELFDGHGIDLRIKKLKDTNMPLYIIASNITKRVPTIFSNDIPILDAIKASCCLPGVFRPYVLYDNVYIDGHHLTPCIASVMSENETTLVLSLSKHRNRQLTPSVLESMSPIDFINELYSMSNKLIHDHTSNDRTLCLSYPGLYSDSDISEFLLEEVLSSAGTQLNRFLSPHVLN